MLTREDLEQIRLLVREEVSTELQRELQPIKEDIKKIWVEIAAIRKELHDIWVEIALIKQDIHNIWLEIDKMWKEISALKKGMQKLHNNLYITQKVFDQDIVETIKRVDHLDHITAQILVRDQAIKEE